MSIFLHFVLFDLLNCWGRDSVRLSETAWGESCTNSNLRHQLLTWNNMYNVNMKVFFSWQSFYLFKILCFIYFFLTPACVISAISDIHSVQRIIWLMGERYSCINVYRSYINVYCVLCTFWASDKLACKSVIPLSFIFLFEPFLRLGTSG